jgi:hypothetical protein
MSKTQKFWSNILIIFIGYVVPIIVIKMNGSGYNYSSLIQIFSLLVILVSGGVLFYLNNKNRKKFAETKFWFIIFEILGVLGILYALAPLYFIFAFRNGINF